MAETNTLASLYQTFGLTPLVNQLETEEKWDELKKLEASVSQFVLAKSLTDLPAEAAEQLEKTEMLDAQQLYRFFSENIENYQERLESYGRDFRNTILS